MYIKGNIHELGELIRYCENTRNSAMCRYCPFSTFLSAISNNCVAPLEDMLVVEEDEEEDE